MLLGGPAFAQEEAPGPAASPPLDRPIGLGDFPNFDAGQETPAAPVTPAPGPDPYPDGPQSSRFLLKGMASAISWPRLPASFRASRS